MKYLDIKIVEALPASQYRNLVKGWNKERYAEIFLNPKYKHDKNGYRVYIPIADKFRPDAPTKSASQIKIEQFLAQNNYEMVDYVKGLVQDVTKKQQIKIGKVLTKLNRQDLLNEFNKDKNREGTKSTYMVVISRHPYDIAGMSTQRGWTSCMNLKTGINSHYVPLDIKEGSVVAYVTTADDFNLQNPTGRLLIKPFVDIIGKSVIYFGIESVVYGTDVPGFKAAVKQWVGEVNDNHELEDVAILRVNNKLYRDSELSSQVAVRGKSITPDMRATIEKIRLNPSIIFDIENPPEAYQFAAFHERPRLFGTMMDQENYTPSDSIQAFMVSKNSDWIKTIIGKGITPSHAAQNAALSDDWRYATLFMQSDIKMSDEGVSLAVEQSAKLIPELVKHGYTITKDMLIKGLRSDPYIFDWYTTTLKEVDDDVALAAIENGYADMVKMHKLYSEKHRSIPEKFLETAAKGQSAYKTYTSILEYNNENPDHPIPATEKNFATAMVTDVKTTSMMLWRNVMKADASPVTERGWYEFLSNIRAPWYIVDSLLNKEKITNDTTRRLIPSNGNLLQFVDDATVEDQIAAVKQAPDSIRYVNDPPLELQLLAVGLDPNAIGAIENPSFDVFRKAVSYKEKGINWDEGDTGNLEVYSVLTSMIEGLDSGTLTESNVQQLLKILVSAEPHRIISVINYNDPNLQITEELQLMCVDEISSMIPMMLDNNMLPSDAALVRHAKTHDNVWTIFDKLAYRNRTLPEDQRVELPDEFYMAFIHKGTRDARWLINTTMNSGFKLSRRVVNELIKEHPHSIISVLANKMDVSDDQVMHSAKHGNFTDNDLPTFLSAVQNKYGGVPPEIFNTLIQASPDRTNGKAVMRFLTIKMWAERSDVQLPTSTLKLAIDYDYRNMLLMEPVTDELRDYNYEVNGYWEPLSIGASVRLSNPKAPPKFTIKKILGDYYVIEKDGKDQRFGKDRIQRANGVAAPADYNKKQELFKKKYPEEGALNDVVKLARNGEVLESDVQRVTTSYGLTEPEQTRSLVARLKAYEIKMVTAYDQEPDDDDIVF